MFYRVDTEPEQVAKINQTLRITEEVIRYLIISLENIRYLNQPAKVTKTKAVSKAKETKGEEKE